MLTLTNERRDENLTQQLRGVKKYFARSNGSLTESLIVAARCAMKNAAPYWIYASNSYGVGCWRVTHRERDCRCFVGNSGRVAMRIDPDLTVTVFDAVEKDETNTDGALRPVNRRKPARNKERRK